MIRWKDMGVSFWFFSVNLHTCMVILYVPHCMYIHCLIQIWTNTDITKISKFSNHITWLCGLLQVICDIYDDWYFSHVTYMFLLFPIKVHVMCDGCGMPGRRCLLFEHLLLRVHTFAWLRCFTNFVFVRYDIFYYSGICLSDFRVSSFLNNIHVFHLYSCCELFFGCAWLSYSGLFLLLISIWKRKILINHSFHI